MGAAFAAGYAMRPTDSIVIIVMAVWVVVAERRHLLAVVAGAVPPLVVLVGVNLAIYHQPLSPYYTGGQSFDVSGTMAVALAGNLISPARGLLIFCPLVALSVVGVVVRWRAGELTAFWKALAVIPVLHWIVISAFKHWWGGDSYGPRFFTDLVPVFVVLALPAVEGLARLGDTRSSVVDRGVGGPSPSRPSVTVRARKSGRAVPRDRRPTVRRPGSVGGGRPGRPDPRGPGVERRGRSPGRHPALGLVLEQRARRASTPTRTNCGTGATPSSPAGSGRSSGVRTVGRSSPATAWTCSAARPSPSGPSHGRPGPARVAPGPSGPGGRRPSRGSRRHGPGWAPRGPGD